MFYVGLPLTSHVKESVAATKIKESIAMLSSNFPKGLGPVGEVCHTLHNIYPHVFMNLDDCGRESIPISIIFRRLPRVVPRISRNADCGRFNLDLGSLGNVVPTVPLAIVLSVHQDVIITASIAIADIARLLTVVYVDCFVV